MHLIRMLRHPLCLGIQAALASGALLAADIEAQLASAV